MPNKVKMGSDSIPPPKKKRGRKRTKKRYFTEDTEAAIAEYLASTNQAERDHIYSTRIHYALYKLAENLIHTFKFYYTEVDSLEDLKHEVICFLIEKLDYFDPTKGSKAFSYFSIVGKNYLILYNNNNYKKKKITTDVMDADEDDGVLRDLGRPERKQDLKDFIDYFTEYIDAHIFKIFKKENDRKVADTPVITKVTKILKKLYKSLYDEYKVKGYVKI
jgi:hypothetical protein